MISFVELTNFKSFSHIFWDLRGSNGVPKKLAFIYGENGAGKTNLISSLPFVSNTLETLSFADKLLQFTQSQSDNQDEPNAFALKNLLSSKTLVSLIRLNKSLASDDPMRIKIGFWLDGKEGFYYAKFQTVYGAEAILEEKLYYQLNTRSGYFFDIDIEKNTTLSPSIFFNIKYRNAIQDKINQYWGKHSFLSILVKEIQNSNDEYLQRRVAPTLLNVISLLHETTAEYRTKVPEMQRVTRPMILLHPLMKGVIKDFDDPKLLVTESFLNLCFTQLYSDIKRAYYKLEKVDKHYEYELYFDKYCAGKKISIPMRLESTGTRKILDVLPLIFVCLSGKTVLIDEVDTGIHDVLMCEIVKSLLPSLLETNNSQFIASTHNTLLLDELEPENVYILSGDILGNKEISCLTSYPRTQKNHSIRRRYLMGIYQGIPETGYLDFKEIVDDTVDKMYRHVLAQGEK